MAEFRFSPRQNRAGEIPWEPWSSAAFLRAKREGKPILLSISAVWCHWCHVMDETTYSDSEVISAIRLNFVPIRVDNDERPDVNARYNMGGWPTTAFLAADGTTLTGATYVPPKEMRGILSEIAQWYGENQATLAERSAAMRSVRPSLELASKDALNEEAVLTIVRTIEASFDEEFGGFGDAPKFPQPEVLEMLLTESQATGNERAHAIAVRSLLAMANGGMYDHVEGGFFRYSTTRDWSVPHFEKMAEDHAGLIRALALVLRRSPKHELHATLRSSVDYVRRILYDEDAGTFAGSQDADEAYYALPIEQRRAHGAPFVDRTVYADRNAALAGAFVLAAAELEDDATARAGARTLDVLHEEMRDSDGLLFHVRREREAPAVRGLLGDQVAYLRALLDAHEVIGDEKYAERAAALADAIEKKFRAESGGYRDHAGIEETLGRLELQDRPIVDNSLLAESLLRLRDLFDERRYHVAAETTLLLYANNALRAGAFAATYARALRRYLSSSVTARIVAAESDGELFREVARRLPSPFVSIRSILPQHAASVDLPESPSPAAYLCTAGRCGPPIFAAEQLRAAFDAIAGHDGRTNIIQNQQPQSPTTIE
jgi:uncharacterized protein YyaL (SSP411 family)